MRKTAWLLGLLLAGCASDKGETLACPRPDGTSCESLSSVYARTTPPVPPLIVPAAPELSAAGPAPASARPELQPARLLRVWVAPWQDEDGDLHDRQYLYIVLEPAAWSLGPARIVRPPQPPAAGGPQR